MQATKKLSFHISLAVEIWTNMTKVNTIIVVEYVHFHYRFRRINKKQLSALASLWKSPSRAYSLHLFSYASHDDVLIKGKYTYDQ